MAGAEGETQEEDAISGEGSYAEVGVVEEVQDTGRQRIASTRLSQKHSVEQKKKAAVTGSSQDEQKNVFVDADAMKAKVRQNLSKPKYNVRDYYKDKGFGQAVARSYTFEVITLGVIAFNALWIAIDTDLNDSSMLINAHPAFQIAENLFCAFFSFEWTVRFLAFKEKKYGMKDPWFMFDSLLVLAMVLETWVMNVVILATGGSSASGGDSSIMRIARLLRLSRMTRMARLLRAMPELMILIKGMMAATRSVLFTLLLMTIVLYVFGIAFKQLADGTEVGERYFGSVTESMFYLLIYGALMDSIGSMARELAAESHLYLFIFFFFVLLAALTVMNMLIGVLCEVVSAVAATEKEEMLVSYVNGKLHKVVSLLDEDGTMSISKKEFASILDNMEAVRCLQDVGVDVVGLVDLSEAIFNDGDDDEEKELSFGDFMEVVLQLRGSNNATVRDIVDLRKIIRDELRETRVFITRECAAMMTMVGGKEAKGKKAKRPATASNELNSSDWKEQAEVRPTVVEGAETDSTVGEGSDVKERFSVEAVRFLPFNSFQDCPAMLPQASAPIHLLSEAEPFGRNVEILAPLCTTLGQVEAWSPGQNVGWAPLPQPPRLSETPAAAKQGWKKPTSKPDSRVPSTAPHAEARGSSPEREALGSKNSPDGKAVGGSGSPSPDGDGGGPAAQVGACKDGGGSGGANVVAATDGPPKAAAPHSSGGSVGFASTIKEDDVDYAMMTCGAGLELQPDHISHDLCASEVQDGLHKEPCKGHETPPETLKGEEGKR